MNSHIGVLRTSAQLYAAVRKNTKRVYLSINPAIPSLNVNYSARLIAASPLVSHHFGEGFGDNPSESGRARSNGKKGAVETGIRMTFLLK